MHKVCNVEECYSSVPGKIENITCCCYNIFADEKLDIVKKSLTEKDGV
jgi:hypothetical protein